MTGWTRLIRATLVTGSCASVGSTAALALAARAEGRAAVRPINATSHWLNGEAAASHEGIDARRTGVGYLTNHLACLFWAFFFESARGTRRAGPAVLLRDAAVMSAIACVVDYRATPKRFTPGWEFVLSRKGMAVAYGGLALGLGIGAWIVQPGARRQDR